MKKKIFLLIMLFIPVLINAKTINNFNVSKNYTNKYIYRFKDYNDYIELNTNKYGYNDSIYYESGFEKGGFLNKKEFLISKDTSGNTYLFNGANYWTMTNSGSQYYILDIKSIDNLKLINSNETSGSRITEYVKSNIKVYGSGTYSDPWKFKEIKNIKITYDNNGGTGCTTKTVKKGNRYGTLCTPTKENYTFKGWYSDSSLTTEVNENTIMRSNENIILYAAWRNNLNCEFSGTLAQGAEYTNGQYTYRYKQQGTESSSWENINEDGWGVILTDKNSTDPVTTELCASINGKPIVSMSYMFKSSQATTFDLSSFNTSNVTNMVGMFYQSKATTLDLSSFDTSKVTNMSWMFQSCQATTLDLSGFDTSKVTNMNWMFFDSKATTLDLSSFDTSKVTNMYGMFNKSQATTLDLSSFDTSNVTDMSAMFGYSKATTLDLSSFNTSKVTDMKNMFEYSKATTLDLSSFNTSKVMGMYSMFRSSQAPTLDLSSFDTSNVIVMSWMFYNSQATTIYVSNKWNTSKVTSSNSSSSMFISNNNLVGGAGTRYSSSNPSDKTYARVDGGTSNPGYFTLKTN